MRLRQKGLLGKDDRGAEQRRTAEKQHQTQQNEQRFSDGLTPCGSARSQTPSGAKGNDCAGMSAGRAARYAAFNRRG